MKRLWDGLSTVVFWLISPLVFLFVLVFAVVAWALGYGRRTG